MERRFWADSWVCPEASACRLDGREFFLVAISSVSSVDDVTGFCAGELLDCSKIWLTVGAGEFTHERPDRNKH